MRHLLAASLLVAILACGRGSAETEAAAARVPVGLGTITRDSMPEALTLTGRLEAQPGGAAMLTAPAAGVVRAIHVQVGDQVRQGSLVAELEVPELVADAAQKGSAAAQAEREAARQQELLADGVTSARQAEEAASNARQTSAADAAARHLLSRTRVRSPLAGRVQEVMVQRGERVDAGRPLARILAPDTLDLSVPVAAADLGRLRSGMPVAVTQDGDTLAVRGRVSGLAPGVDSLTNAGEAVIRVPNRDGRLHPGASAIARIRLGVRADVLTVPDSAIVLAGDSSVVFVVGPDSVAHQRVVERGIRSGGRSEVRGDIRSGDRVVTTGAFGLQDGMRVAPAASASPK